MTTTAQPAEAFAEARRLMRRQGRAALATVLAETGDAAPGAPYVSLVQTACAGDASPLLLLSDLAQHTRNLAADPRVSLLFDDTAGLADPLTGARLSVLGRARRCADPAVLARYVARHPGAGRYAGFGDFHLYRVAVERGHFVAGFGRIAWIDAVSLRSPGGAALIAAEDEIVAHMNADHADALALYAERFAGRGGGDWRMTGIDPDGIDLRRGDDAVRIDFTAPVSTPQAARAALVGLAAARLLDH